MEGFQTAQDVEKLLLVRGKTDVAEQGSEYRPTAYFTCQEVAFLATAFGPDYLDKEVTQNSFLEAFRVGSLEAQADYATQLR